MRDKDLLVKNVLENIKPNVYVEGSVVLERLELALRRMPLEDLGYLSVVITGQHKERTHHE